MGIYVFAGICRLHVSIFWVYACMYACMYVCKYACACVCACVRVRVRVCVSHSFMASSVVQGTRLPLAGCYAWIESTWLSTLDSCFSHLTLHCSKGFLSLYIGQLFQSSYTAKRLLVYKAFASVKVV